MRTTVALDDDLVAKARSYTGLKETSALLRAALTALIERESARRLAGLAGSEPRLSAIPRRRAEFGVILVDTSVWVEHLRRGDERLAALLEDELVLVHPHVIGELFLGQLRQRDALSDLMDLPVANLASDGEVLQFIERETLHGTGIGYVDAHLLAATRLTPGATLWTRDRRLLAAAERLSLAARLSH